MSAIIVRVFLAFTVSPVLPLVAVVTISHNNRSVLRLRPTPYRIVSFSSSLVLKKEQCDGQLH